MRRGLPWTEIFVFGSLAAVGAAWIRYFFFSTPLSVQEQDLTMPAFKSGPAPPAQAPTPSGPGYVATMHPPLASPDGSALAVYPGRAYYAVLSTSGLASSVADEGKATAEAQSLGFTGVNVSKSRPAGFPGTASGDYYVSATYAGAPRYLDIVQGNVLGHVRVVEAFEVS